MNNALSADRFADELQQLMPAFLGAMIRRERNAVSQGIITLPQFLGLSFLRERPGAPVNQFAATLGLKLSSASGLLDRMARLGLVRRNRSAQDRRVVLLSLTEKGTRMVDEIARQKRDSVAQIFAALTPGERAAYLKLMRKAVSGLHED